MTSVLWQHDLGSTAYLSKAYRVALTEALLELDINIYLMSLFHHVAFSLS